MEMLTKEKYARWACYGCVRQPNDKPCYSFIDKNLNDGPTTCLIDVACIPKWERQA